MLHGGEQAIVRRFDDDRVRRDTKITDRAQNGGGTHGLAEKNERFVIRKELLPRVALAGSDIVSLAVSDRRDIAAGSTASAEVREQGRVTKLMKFCRGRKERFF